MKPLPVLLSLACAANAQTLPPTPEISIPRADTKPLLTADANDPAWLGAAIIPSLSFSEGVPSHLPKPLTEVRLLWDAEALYARFTTSSESLESPFDERDANHYEGDVVEVFFDPVGDGVNYFEVQVSPRNKILDLLALATAPLVNDPNGIITNRHELWHLREWNMPGLQTAATVENGQWITDIALPAKPLLKRLQRETFEGDMSLRANFLRYTWPTLDGKRWLAAQNWSVVMCGMPHLSPARMGTLRLKEDVRPARR